MNDGGVFSFGLACGMVLMFVMSIVMFPYCGMERTINPKHINACVKLCESVGGFKHVGGTSGNCYCKLGKLEIPKGWNEQN